MMLSAELGGWNSRGKMLARNFTAVRRRRVRVACETSATTVHGVATENLFLVRISIIKKLVCVCDRTGTGQGCSLQSPMKIR